MLNIVPQDKNGKPLRAGQYVVAEILNGAGPPKNLFGRILYVGPVKSFVLPDERKGEEIDNSEIEIKID